MWKYFSNTIVCKLLLYLIFNISHDQYEDILGDRHNKLEDQV